MFDSLMDPVLLIKHAVQRIMFDQKGPIGAKGCQLMKGFVQSGCDSIDEYILKSEGSKELRKKKYDKVRRSVIHLFVQLQQLVDTFSDFYECLDGVKLSEDLEKYEHHHAVRYQVTNGIRYDLILLTSLVSEVSSQPMITLMLLKQVAVLQSDLDTAQEFNTIQSVKLKGRCKSPEEVKSLGWWSFGLVIQTMIPRFLKRYTLKKEMRRLVVIDRLGSEY